MKKISNPFRKSIFLCMVSLIAAVVFIPSAYAEWTAVDLPGVSSDWRLYDVYFASPDEGWAVGEDGGSTGKSLFLHYLNGTWTSTSMDPYQSLRGIHFTSSNEGWAVGAWSDPADQALFHYSDGTWTSVASPDVSSDWMLFGVYFAKSNDGWAVGADWFNKRGVLLHYSNGSWASVTPPDVSSDWVLSGVHFTSPKEGWAVGADYVNARGVLFYYSNSSWTSVLPPPVSASWDLWDLRGVCFTSSNEGWAVGMSYTDSVYDGVLLHYSNGTWTFIVPPDVSSDWVLLGVHFTSPSEGWAVGRDYANKAGILLHYSNGTWTSVSPPSVSTSWDLRGVFFASSNEGWAVGIDHTNNKGVLLKYFTAPVPDLTGQWSSLIQTCKTSKTTKCKITGSLIIQNVGTLNASSSRVNFYLSDDAVYDEGDTFLKSVSTGSIKAGASKTKKLSYSLPVDESATGRYIIAVIDADNGVAESNEGNNQVVFGPIP